MAGWSALSLRRHYFADADRGVSLCGRWTVEDPTKVPTDLPDWSSANCRMCLKRKQHLDALAAAGLIGGRR